MKAIAMKATQEDWDSVKDLVKKFIEVNNIEESPYLVTNYLNEFGLVTNVNNYSKNKFGRTFYETFDRAIFLDALDIVEEKIWNGSELQIKHDNGWVDCHELNYYRLKPINTEVKQLQELAEKLGYKTEKL